MRDFFEKIANIAKCTLDISLIRQGRRGSEISSLFHVAFCLLFATISSRYTLFLCATSLPHPASCFRYHTNPPIRVLREFHRNILQCSRLVPVCWQYHQPQPSLLESSFLIFLCISLPGFCLFYFVPTVLP